MMAETTLEFSDRHGLDIAINGGNFQGFRVETPTLTERELFGSALQRIKEAEELLALLPTQYKVASIETEGVTEVSLWVDFQSRGMDTLSNVLTQVGLKFSRIWGKHISPFDDDDDDDW